MTHTIVLLPGDGIGPEVAQAARAVLEKAAAAHGLPLEFSSHDIGGCAIACTQLSSFEAHSILPPTV